MEVLYSCFLTFPQNFASLGDHQYTKEFGTVVYKVKSYTHNYPNKYYCNSSSRINVIDTGDQK